jgi:membrane-associated protease RseP (regulator of RpoE activity)
MAAVASSSTGLMKLTRHLGLLFPVLFAACDRDSSFDLTDLVQELRKQGATVTVGSGVSQAFFSVQGTVLSVNGQDVQAFEYASAAAAEAEAKTVSSDGGTIGTVSVSWVATPHFYRRERVIALYVGDNAGVKTDLERVLGSQFAGR